MEDPLPVIERAVDRMWSSAAEEEFRESLDDPPDDHVVLGLMDRLGLTLAYVRRDALRPPHSLVEPVDYALPGGPS